MPIRAAALIASVIAAGAIALAVAATLPGAWPLESPAVALVVLAGVLAGEFAGIQVRRSGENGEITPSTTFVFALLILAGPAGIVLNTVASIVADTARRKAPVKVAFNAAQYAISLSAAALVLHFGAGVPGSGDIPFEPNDVGWLVVAAIAFFIVNAVIVAAVIALLHHDSVWRYFSEDFVFQASSAGLLLGLSPIVVLAAQFSLVILPLLTLPLLAVAQYQRQAVLNEHQALHDGLTGLPNRMLLRERLDHALRSAQHTGGHVAVMLMDLDNFKEINDSLGHHHGDLLLNEIAIRLSEVVEEPATVARLGGDEFAVLLPEVFDDHRAIAFAERVQSAVNEPVDVAGMELAVGASIGVALYPEHGSDVDSLLQRADIAMYCAKRGRLGHAVYSPEQDVHSAARLELAHELRRAVEQGELITYYQPKVDVASGRVIGLEALMRWDHPERGIVPPDHFIPTLEQSGLIGPATMAMIAQVLDQNNAWKRAGLDVTVSVNLSTRLLIDRRLPRLIAEMLAGSGAKPEVLELELTESMIMADAERAELILSDLSAMGCGISIDDFGTGYSSLVYLRQLPVDTLKIDRSFIIDLARSRNDGVIVRSTIELAHNLGLRVVAEGVEDLETLSELGALGCDVVQGFVIARPMSAAAAERWMHEHAAVLARAAA